MIAETIAGDGDRAFDYYLRINPSAREEISEVHRCEPYVYAQMIAGRDAATHGEAKNSWLTGTAAWNFVAITQWILGIRPELRRPAGRPVPAGRMGGLHRRAAVPRGDVSHRRPQAARRTRPSRVAARRRRAGRRQRRSPRSGRIDGRGRSRRSSRPRRRRVVLTGRRSRNSTESAESGSSDLAIVAGG